MQLRARVLFVAAALQTLLSAFKAGDTMSDVIKKCNALKKAPSPANPTASQQYALKAKVCIKKAFELCKGSAGSAAGQRKMNSRDKHGVIYVNRPDDQMAVNSIEQDSDTDNPKRVFQIPKDFTKCGIAGTMTKEGISYDEAKFTDMMRAFLYRQTTTAESPLEFARVGGNFRKFLNYESEFSCLLDNLEKFPFPDAGGDWPETLSAS